MAIGKTGRGVLTAANDTYHGLQSLKENGAIAHASAYARVLMLRGNAKCEDEALARAHHEVQRLRSHMDGEQMHREARMALRSEEAVVSNLDAAYV
ncbi:hypothetical protein [Herbaspirillum rubrisubalbicans]|uniref:hypothetical protein n=1 Tax=Herbaspirillum rubrisubalbicans TaxID=80842 RepID=UPI00073A04DC|nr:hypothetical protein [Herbaspirillum rubrisubalbicans]